MMEFPMVNTLLHSWKRSVKDRWCEHYCYDLTEKGMTRRIEIIREKNSICYLVDYCIINRFNIRRESHIKLMQEALHDLEITIDELKQKGLEER